MKRIFHRLHVELEKNRPLALATIIETKGSTPQVLGASALFSTQGLLAGTLGGGLLEGDAIRMSKEVMRVRTSMVHKFELTANITEEEGAICGGTAMLLFDANPGADKDVFSDMEHSIMKGKQGILATFIHKQDEISIKRLWVEYNEQKGHLIQKELNEFSSEMASCLEKGQCLYVEKSDNQAVFLQPVRPLPKLIIAGAGHIGKALAHMAHLLDFEITVVDDRPEYANWENLPDADHILMDSIGKAIRQIILTGDTYVVVVTRGHKDDAEALKACIDVPVSYIGMIGSNRKIKLMRENFLSNGWATEAQFDQVHAPIGLKIGAQTVEEIAVSICAQLIEVRNQKKHIPENPLITAIILAAGESKRMGKPKLLLPFGDKSIIEEVVTQANLSVISRTVVVLGSEHNAISSLLKNYPVMIAHNKLYKNGMLSSVQCGLNAVTESNDAIMILLGDQPMIGKAVIDSMIESYKGSNREIIIATYQGERGHPLLIGSRYLKEIMALPIDKSLKDFLTKHPGDIKEMETSAPEILRDIDTEKDYQNEIKYHKNYD